MLFAQLSRGFTKSFKSSVSQVRELSSASAWQLHSYSGPLTFHKDLAIPRIVESKDVLVQVKAASINPIDARMADGYGRNLISILRQVDKKSLTPLDPFPLTLGRDFSGVVIDVGGGVKNFRVGDEVYGTVGIQRQGTHATHVVVSEDTMCERPKSVTHVEAASVAYVANTVYAALTKFGRVSPGRCAGLRALVHAGAGGIGSFAIQLLKVWGAHVTSTCSMETVNMVRDLGADLVVDRNSPDAYDQLNKECPFDIILDPISSSWALGTLPMLGLWRNSVYVSLVSPLLSNTDQYGPLGLGKTVLDISPLVLKAAKQGAFFTYAYFIPDKQALTMVAQYIDQGKIRPVVERVISMTDVESAYKIVGENRGRGKTVVDMSSLSSTQ